MSDGEAYYVRRWGNPDAEWGNHQRFEAWDPEEAAESWAQLMAATKDKQALETLTQELKAGIDLQVRHHKSAQEYRMTVYVQFKPEYVARNRSWNREGEQRLEPA